MPLTDKLRAAVFARDKGICSFSGLSLWMLDYGTAPFSHPDWPDHIKPISRGGKDTLDNVVCASFHYNSKKLNNGRDCGYLFREGRPTEEFFWTHGELSRTQAQLLKRNACLTEADWYFNRALFNVKVAIADEVFGADVVRKRDYWLNSAYKRLLAWRRLSGPSGPTSFTRRGLIRYPSASDVQLMLSLATADHTELQKVYHRLAKHYRANCRALDAFVLARTPERREVILQKAGRDNYVTEPLINVVRQNARRLQEISARASPQ